MFQEAEQNAEIYDYWSAKGVKEKTCCFTGHRDMSEHRIKDVVKTLEKELVQLIEEGCCYFGAGGALGFDTIAAHTVLHLKEKYPHIKLILVLPCVDQAKSWSYEDKVVYEDIKEIIPIDNEIDNVLYFNNYVEKGIVVRPKVSSLKQFWTEYRLINNEKADKKHYHHTLPNKKQEQSLDNFDELFDALSQRVSEINKYIDELKEMRNHINMTSNKLEKDKEKLADERKQFLDYKKSEEHKIKEEKENLKINFARLQTIIDDLDKKLVSIDNNDK